MEVILCQDVPAIGKLGEVIRVKDGYARNFLLPQKKAYLATPANLKKIELEKQKKAEVENQEKTEAQQQAEKLNGLSVTVAVEVNDLDKLYGSVTDVDILKVLEAEGHVFDKKQLVLEAPIEELGIYDVGISLHPEVTAKIRVWVTKK